MPREVLAHAADTQDVRDVAVELVDDAPRRPWRVDDSRSDDPQPGLDRAYAMSRPTVRTDTVDRTDFPRGSP
jgi:hypothetical protein